MKKVVCAIEALSLALLFCFALPTQGLNLRHSETPSKIQLETAVDLIHRVLPLHFQDFVLYIDQPPANGRDSFVVSTNGTHILIRGTSGVALASGFHWYLKYMCNASISWTGDNLDLPSPLPSLAKPYLGETSVAYRYYLNPVTFGYTTVWWDWPRWERELDWMALHGINLFLAFNGQEKIYQNMFARLGPDATNTLNEFFTGPAFLPWNRFGNVDGWQGALPQSWIDAQVDLQKRVLQRARSLGMMAVLPGFTGHVPSSLKSMFPNSKFQQFPAWDGFPDGTWQLDPLDPLYEQLGQSFYREAVALFGSDHFFSMDPFNEEDPPTSDPTYIGKVSAAYFRAMASVDPNAVWILNGWIFTNKASFWQGPAGQALLTAVPEDNILVIDAWAEMFPKWLHNDNFYSRPFVWAMLHNFGGRPGLYGTLWKVNYRPYDALSVTQFTVGMGMQPEGLGTNPIVYELMSENMWRTHPLSESQLSEWVSAYAQRRYGTTQTCATRAWKTLQFSVYNCSSLQEGASGSILASRPALGIDQSPKYVPINEYYSVSTLVSAVKDLISCVGSNADDTVLLRESQALQTDVYEGFRQVISDKAYAVYQDMTSALSRGDAATFKRSSTTFLEMLQDVEVLTATRQDSLLGSWISDARSWGLDKAEQDYLEVNARILVTIWGVRENTRLHEYAYRLWSGLISDFYLPRWQLFVSMASDALANNKAFDMNKFTVQVLDFEEKWVTDVTTKIFPHEPTGQLWDVVAKLAPKYLN